MRARAQIEEQESSGKSQIVVTEIPYQVNKENLVTGDRRAGGGEEARGHQRGCNDESDKDGMRIVIELKRDAIPNVVLNQLYKHTPMQSTFGVIMLALDNGAPKVMNLKEHAPALHRPPARGHHPPDPVRPRRGRRPGSTSSRASRSPSTTSTR